MDLHYRHIQISLLYIIAKLSVCGGIQLKFNTIPRYGSKGACNDDKHYASLASKSCHTGQVCVPPRGIIIRTYAYVTS